MFKKYPKIHRLGKEETDGILLGRCYVEEKIDGANTSVWLENNEVCCGSRTQKLQGGFNGFVDYVKTNQAIKNCLHDNPTFRLYGEWLVRHTIAYNELSYKKFYLFDITEQKNDESQESFFTRESVSEIGEKYGFSMPQRFGVFDNPNPDDLKQFIGKTNLGVRGEGIVIKNLDFRDKFGNQCYAKMVSEQFKEDNGIIFGGNNKHSETYWEVYVVNKYITPGRVQKVMNKIQPLIDERLDLKHIPRIAQTCYHDMLTEEIWEIQDKVESINFNTLKRIATKKAVQIYKEIITGDLSVAHRQN